MRSSLRIFLALGLIVVLAVPVSAQKIEITDLPLPRSPISKESRLINVVVDPGLKSMSALPTQELRDARAAFTAKQPVSPDILRRLAELRETMAAARYVEYLSGLRQVEAVDALGQPMLQMLPSTGEIPGYTGKNYNSDVAYFGAIAVGGGRNWVLDDMLEAMRFLDPATEPRARINTYIKMLYPQAWAGNELALDAVIEFNGEGKLFGRLSERTRLKIEDTLSNLGTGRGEMKRALAILSRTNRTQSDIDEAIPLLRVAQGSETLAIATMATNLINHFSGTPGLGLTTN